MKRWIGLLTLVIGVQAAEAQVSVGPSCIVSWAAPTMGSDGLPLTSPVSGYNVYVDRTTIVPGTTPPTAQVTTLAWVCGALTAGAHTVAVSAKNATGEGPATIAFPFVLVLGAPPGSPSNLTVR